MKRYESAAPWTSLSVPANGTSSSVTLPYGTTVTVREVAPTAVTGITWGTPVWSGTGVTAGAGNTASFTVGNGTTLAVGLQNPTTLLNGQFTVTKSVTGSGSALGATAGPFTVEYSTTGAAPWTSLSVPANGTSASVSLPYGSTVETERWEDQKDGSARIEQVVFVQRPSQRAIVLGDGGQRIKAIGARARAELEHMLERRVHLFLFVKVRENWVEDRERYAALGLDYDA